MDYNDIRTKLRARNLADTFPLIRQKAAETGRWELTEEVENLWMTYQQMMQFMLQGVNDAQGGTIRKQICAQLLLVASRLERMERLKNNASEKYVSTWKSLKNTPSFSSLVDSLEKVDAELAAVAEDELLRESVRTHRLEALEQQHEATLQNLFHWTWVSEGWQNADKGQANRIIMSDSITAFDKAVFVSAVTLSLLEFSDMAKLQFLLDCYLVEEPQVAQRALVGFVLIFSLQFEQVKSSRALKDQLFTYGEDAAFIHDIYATMMQLQMSCTTDSVSSKMRNDIMPVLMQGAMRRKKTKKDIDLNELTKNGENPEWMNAAEGDEVMDAKVREMAEMQMDGADVYYASFSLLKGYPFFGQMPHWFYPFSMQYVQAPALQGMMGGQLGKVIRLILSGSPFCNSDKYSLGFMFQGLAGLGEAAVEAQIARQLPPGTDMDELAANAEQLSPSKADIRRQYIFDLYRFFHSYPYKHQFQNPFAILKDTPVTPYGNAWMRQLFAQRKDELAQYADFLMRKEFYTAALHIFTTLADNEYEPSLASIWQKIGFCHQKLKETDAALHAYTVANNIKPNSKWTLSHLATLSHTAGRMEDAATYYMELLAMSPDNLKYLSNAALALMRSDRFDEAEPLLHKAFYLDESAPRTRQLLAWCLMVNRQTDKAKKYLADLMENEDKDMAPDEPGHHDTRLFWGLALLTEGKTREAYDQLRGSITEGNAEPLRQHLATLTRHQVIDKNLTTLFADALTLNID